MNVTIKMLENEYWWGGSVSRSEAQPFGPESEFQMDGQHWGGNQSMPLFLSNKGRYIWCDIPMTIKISGGEIALSADAPIEVCEAGATLRDAYLAASQKHFPFSGKVPPAKFFETAQYNTWMELDYNQSQEGVLTYARGLIANGYEPGVLMIDEGWHGRYGLWEFDPVKFPDPKGMVDELHEMGFTVMLWVVPLVSPDGKEFCIATDPWLKRLVGGGGNKQYFLRTDDGKVALVRWWNGYSAILNMCNPDDREFLDSKLQKLVAEYGIDGFKFDGGNLEMYHPNNVVNGTQSRYSAVEMNIAWNEFGARYTYHEYKDTFKGGGKATIQRLQDRSHSWTSHGLTSILPAALLQGLIGHNFICRDMVGGGQWSFNYEPNFTCDMELFIRMAQCSALFPMMQFSWAPWRLLDQKHASLCLEAAKLHQAYASELLLLVEEAAKTGEPIVRHMEYQYPHKGYATIQDQFMLGANVLVAPVLEKGATTRAVVLPTGKWRYCDGLVYDGGKTVTVPAPIEVLPYFTKVE